jgi:hypothetical protein
VVLTAGQALCAWQSWNKLAHLSHADYLSPGTVVEEHVHNATGNETREIHKDNR